jgi:flagellar biosynthesis/type III secretory pathway protein FliH
MTITLLILSTLLIGLALGAALARLWSCSEAWDEGYYHGRADEHDPGNTYEDGYAQGWSDGYAAAQEESPIL